MTSPTVIAAELSMESQGLRAVLRVEVESAHHAFLIESHLCDLRKNAEECLPAALSLVAPQALRQILAAVETHLTQSICADLALGASLMTTPIAPDGANSSTSNNQS